MAATRRRHTGALRWVRAGAFGIVTYAALGSLGFYPSALAPIIALAVAVFALLSPAIAVPVFIVVAGIPIVAANMLAGALFLLVAFGTLHYLTEYDARAFLIITLAFAASTVHAEWGLAVLAGYLLGTSEGAVIALAACVGLEVTGLLIGAVSLGNVTTGGAHGVVDLHALALIKNPLSGGWLAESYKHLNVPAAVEALASARFVPLLVVQPLLWLAGAVMAGSMRRPAGDPKRGVIGIGAGAVAVVAVGGASIAASVILGGPVTVASMLQGLGASLVVALGGIAVSDWIFTPLAPLPKHMSEMAVEDADVDELLRMISNAEDELTTKHTVQRTVLITDMKSFSRMTEDLGSAQTAKLVQKHRDLLLPVVTKAGGRGKSTGGDGLLAAFDSPAAAIAATVLMQQKLDEYNSAHPASENILVRAGIASGEVVLDKGGKPFLGEALNLAARVMNLADGGQVFTTRADLSAAGGSDRATVSHGEFRLKNIAAPVEIIEILWREGQEARSPQQQPPAA